MYTNYFGLKSHPFRLGPDPQYFFPAPFHKLVSKCLLEGLIGTLRMTLISGPSGVGKSLLLTRFMEQLGKTYPAVFISNPRLPFEEFLASIQTEFNIPVQDHSAAARLSAIEDFGEDLSRLGKRAVILVDEADSISQEAAQALSRLTTPTAEGVSPFFVVLAVRNSSSNALSLLLENKDAAKVYSLLPLLADQVGPYIDFRLRQAGYSGESPFSPEAITRLEELSHGIPRLINRLCDAALLEASLTDQKLVSPQLIDEVAQGLWLALGNEDSSGNPPLAKGMEAAFLPAKKNKPKAPLEPQFQAETPPTPPPAKAPVEDDAPTREMRTEAPLSPSPQEDFSNAKRQPHMEKDFYLDEPFAAEQTPTLLNLAQRRPKARAKHAKTRLALASGAAIVLLLGSAYLLLWAPERTFIPAATEVAEAPEITAGEAESLAEEKTGELLEGVEIAANQPLSLEEDEFDELNAPLDIQPAADPEPPLASPEADQLAAMEPSPEQSSDIPELTLEEAPEPFPEAAQPLEQDATPARAEPERDSDRSSPRERQIAQLLAKAKRQEAAFKLTTPKGDNAFETYTKILEIAPNHPEVAKGLQDIREHYISWGLEAESEKQLDLALVYYQRALNVFPNDFALRTALQRVKARQARR